MTGFYTIRFKLTAIFLFIILAVMIINSFYLYSNLEQYYMKNLSDNLQRFGFLASDFVVGHIRGQIDYVLLSSIAENLSRQAQARVIFINQQGTVVGDSEKIGGLLNQPLEHENVQAALTGTVSSNISYSERIQHQVMQMAVPVKDLEDDVIGVVLLSASLESVYQTLNDIRRYLYYSTVWALLVVGGGSVLLARRFTNPIEELTEAARLMADGKLEQHIEFSSNDEIGRLANQFNHMANRLNYYTGNLKKFAADVAHEVRTPLTTMGLLVKALKEHDLNKEEQEEFIGDLDNELDRLTALVQDLLELSKLDKISPEPEDIRLDMLIKSFVKNNSLRFKQAGITLTVNLEEEPIIVCGMPSQLWQVLGNLVDNALNYTQQGGSVAFSLYRQGLEAVFSIEDTGCGIPQKDIPYIFERFFRVDPARSREKGGTGLGLAIVSEIITKHGGRVWVKSIEGSGSSFFFSLPFKNSKSNGNPVSLNMVK